jgi:hypothetical protein
MRPETCEDKGLNNCSVHLSELRGNVRFTQADTATAKFGKIYLKIPAERCKVFWFTAKFREKFVILEMCEEAASKYSLLTL